MPTPLLASYPAPKKTTKSRNLSHLFLLLVLTYLLQVVILRPSKQQLTHCGAIDFKRSASLAQRQKQEIGMEFSSLPIEVQKIAAECLSLKINERTSLVASVNSGPAKEQAQLVRDAFIALFSERELDGSKKEAAEELAATILVLQQLVTDDEIVKAQISHVVSAADNFVDKCL